MMSINSFPLPAVRFSRIEKAPLPIQPKFAATSKDTFQRTCSLQFSANSPPRDPQLDSFKNEVTQWIERSTEKPSASDLETKIEQASEANPEYLGMPTRYFLPSNFSKTEIKAVFEDLNQLAETLRKDWRTYKQKPYEGAIGEIPFTVQYVNEGEIGRVYRLSVQGKSYALKVYKQAGMQYKTPESHGAYPELANGLFFTSMPIKDLSYCYFGNPKAGYAVTEWLEPGQINYENRPGKTLWEAGYVMTDDFKAEDEFSIEGVCFDHACIKKKNQLNTEEREKHFLPLFPTQPFSVRTFPEKIPSELQLEAFKLLMQKAPTQRWILVNAIPDDWSAEQKAEAIKITIATDSESCVEALKHMFCGRLSLQKTPELLKEVASFAKQHKNCPEKLRDWIPEDPTKSPRLLWDFD